MRLDLAADQFKGLRDGNDRVDAGRDLQSLNFMSASAAHCSDDGSLCSTGDVRLVARFADSLADVLDLCFRGALRDVDNHGMIPLWAGTITKKQRPRF